jgi:Flp pilus assembly pilin Flp
MKYRNMKKKSGQAMVEYIIIVVIVAIAAIAVFGVFSDRIRDMVGGASVELGADQGDVDSATSDSSSNVMRDLTSE